jgi:hypothetical protein
VQASAQASTPAADVVCVLRAWGRAESLTEARRVLRAAHRGMTDEDRRSLEHWVARLSFESLVEVMSSPADVDEHRVEWQGALYHPRQLERLAAWTQDQIETAEVLGIDRRTWSDAVLGSVAWYRSEAQQANRAGTDHDKIAAARRFLGG